MAGGGKRAFSCGHRGKGQYCHRCRQEEDEKRRKDEEKRVLSERIAGSPVPIGHLPRNAAEKALEVIARIEATGAYMEVGGKRLLTMGQREVISVPVGRSYRLICRDDGGAFKYIEVISHEAYNNRLASGGWR